MSTSCLVVSTEERFLRELRQKMQEAGYDDCMLFQDYNVFIRFVNSQDRNVERIAVVVDIRGPCAREAITLVNATHDRWCAVDTSPDDAGEGGWSGVLERRLREAWETKDAAAAEQAALA